MTKLSLLYILYIDYTVFSHFCQAFFAQNLCIRLVGINKKTDAFSASVYNCKHISRVLSGESLLRCDHLSRTRVAARLQLPLRHDGRRIRLICGIAPDRVYTDGRRYRRPGELLPHLFTLTDCSDVLFCCTVPGVASDGCYPLSLPMGARTFLRENLSAHPRDRTACSLSAFEFAVTGVLPRVRAVGTGTRRNVLSVVLAEILIANVVQIDKSSAHSVIALGAGHDLSRFDVVAPLHFLKLRHQCRNAYRKTENESSETYKNELDLRFPRLPRKNEERKNYTQNDEQDDGKRQCPNLSLFHNAPSVNVRYTVNRKTDFVLVII